MAFYDSMIAVLSSLIREDASPYTARADSLTIKNVLTSIAPVVANGIIMETLVGMPSGAGATYTTAYHIESAVVITSLAGVMTLLANPADYSFVGKTITFVGDHTGETMVLLYVPIKTLP